MAINNSKSVPKEKEENGSSIAPSMETVQQAGHFRCHVSAVLNFWNR